MFGTYGCTTAMLQVQVLCLIHVQQNRERHHRLQGKAKHPTTCRGTSAFLPVPSSCEKYKGLGSGGFEDLSSLEIRTFRFWGLGFALRGPPRGGRRWPGRALLAVDFRLKFCGFCLLCNRGRSRRLEHPEHQHPEHQNGKAGGWGLDRGQPGGLSFRHSVMC